MFRVGDSRPLMYQLGGASHFLFHTSRQLFEKGFVTTACLDLPQVFRRQECTHLHESLSTPVVVQGKHDGVLPPAGCLAEPARSISWA